MFLLITYRISNNRTRTKLNKILKNYGSQIQNSVFECRLDNNQTNLLLKDMDKFKNLMSGKDNVRIYSLCKQCTKAIKTYGSAVVTGEPLYYLV